MTTTTSRMTVGADRPELVPVVLDLYRDIHKGIRAELFAVTSAAGQADPESREARVALAAHVEALVDLLVSHAAHEDAHVQPAIERHLPELATAIASDHSVIDGRLVDLLSRARACIEPTDARFELHRLYLELALFTGAYLEHQDVEEEVVMPALESAIGVDAVARIHEAIIAGIPPDEMARTLAVMLPTMNVEDRVELLGGMRAGAPPEVFAGVWSLAGSVLSREDHAAVAARLGLD